VSAVSAGGSPLTDGGERPQRMTKVIKESKNRTIIKKALRKQIKIHIKNIENSGDYNYVESSCNKSSN